MLMVRPYPLVIEVPRSRVTFQLALLHDSSLLIYKRSPSFNITLLAKYEFKLSLTKNSVPTGKQVIDHQDQIS